MILKPLKILSLFIIVTFWVQLCKAQEIKSIGVPYVQNYAKSVYMAGNQNWSVAKGKDAVMYFGNAQGLLTYDGKYWEQYQMPNKQIVRAVAADDQGRIYTGGFGEFGYWAYKNRRLTYTSLTILVPKKYIPKDEIWKIYVDGGKVIFQSFSSIYIHENNKIRVVTGPSAYLFMHQIGKRFYIEVLGKGLFELVSGKLVPLKNTGTVQPSGILSVLPYKNGSLLIGTSKNGLYVYNGENYTPFSTAANNFLSTYQLNNGVRILDKYYAYGTILNGLIIIDENGAIIQRINKSSGLQNNTVLSMYADDAQNLWIGLDNGIDRIELNAPLYFYFDKTGQFGTVYSSLIYQGNIYLGTNQGLFYSAWTPGNSSSFDFKLIPNSQGQVWELSEIDGQLICGHNEGTFSIEGNRLIPISAIQGAWTTKKLHSKPEYLIQGSYTGLVVFKKDAAGAWRFLHRISGFGEPSRYVEQDVKGDIWVSHAYKGLYKLSLSEDLKKVTSVKNYTEKNGLPSDYNINISTVENRLIFSTAKGFMLYDDISDRFTPYTTLNAALAGFATSNKIIPAGPRKYWFINNGKMGLVTLGDAGKISIDSNRFSVLDGRMVQYYENISRISKDIYLVSVDDGFVIYDATNAPDKHSLKLPSVLIRQIEDVTDTYRLISEIGNSGSKIEIPYARNNIRISYTLPWYRQTKIQFQYFLEGYSKQWSDWSPASQKDFTNLSQGNYVFKVRAKINEEAVGKETEFSFRVLPPFYASAWAILLYIILAAILLITGKLLYERKLRKDKQAITSRMQDEKEEFIKKEAEATEKQIVKLQTERLQAELAGKNRELANSAMSLVYKNELLQKLSQEMLKLKDSNGKLLGEDQLRKIQKVIDEGMNDERDWNLFESSFNEAHESFFKKLKANHPDLVPNDLKLCAYLHMNMSSKEMASLLNISLRGVEIRRYRLRKKLDVPHDKNLVEFLMEL
ncbi:triple tyrosine motif-containing protein [Pedobacter psychroterrae]|uniref:Transcriptional regulator n=1 Tax=Pedobacter psychroterrae TaxID=2530453 RepID=A0A4V2MLK9_9SPHI|nr:triple tyrosine motif-containing protein [Pedobacter psychroterrae]TCD02447.1 transcriptional regulator [Pedobacter psychroterrae]